jgi:hypothetical protein
MFNTKLFLLFINLIVCLNAMQLLVPLYIYPSDLSASGAWSSVAKASDSLSVVAIINPASGPGVSSQPDQNYVDGIRILLDKGVHVIGYVATGYGTRNISLVQRDVDTYAGWLSAYRVGGIFFDEASNDPSMVMYYQALYNYTRKQFGCHSKIIINPGAVLPAVYMDSQVRSADTAVIFEDTYAQWLTYTPSEYQLKTLVDTESAVIVHTCPTVASMQNAIQLAQSRNAGFVYVTDRVMNNPYDLLPSYFNDLIMYIVSLD